MYPALDERNTEMETQEPIPATTMTTEPPNRKRKRTYSEASLPTPSPEEQPLFPEDHPRGPKEPSKASEHAHSTTKETTPPPPQEPELSLSTPLHVLRTQSHALAHIANLYTTNPHYQSSLRRTLNAILTTLNRGNRLITCAVGKSSFIAQKLTATLKSLSLPTSFLHACEAAHGDLGDVRSGDAVLFVSFSGKTAELLNLLPHLPLDATIIALTGQTRREDCRLLDGRSEDHGILLPAPIPESEEVSFGVSAPTTSTTVALAVADMLALTLAGKIHKGREGDVRGVFERNHPGGAIGMRSAASAKKMKDVNVKVLELPSPEISGEDDR